jgi:hypothetical protein
MCAGAFGMVGGVTCALSAAVCSLQSVEAAMEIAGLRAAQKRLQVRSRSHNDRKHHRCRHLCNAVQTLPGKRT